MYFALNLQGHIIFGNSQDDESIKKGYLNINDPRLSKEHFEIDVDSDGNWLNITDLGSSGGTWLVILNYLEDQVLPEIEYQNPEIGAFKFELGSSCFTLEEIMELYEQPDVLTDLCLINLYTLIDIKEIKKHDLETRITKAMISQERTDLMMKYMELLRKEYDDETTYLKNRLILKVISGKYQGTEIEIGYRGSKIGVIENQGSKSLVFTSYQGNDTFDENLFDITYKNGSYSLKSYGFSKIYKKFNPHEKHRIFPGHRICAGSQIFTLLQHIHFYIGDTKSVIFEEFTNISDVINISVYAIVQQ